MRKFMVAFAYDLSGEIVIEAENEDEAREKVENLDNLYELVEQSHACFESDFMEIQAIEDLGESCDDCC